MQNPNPEKHNYKISDAEFLEILKRHYCIYSDTAKAISQKYDISYSRQAVRSRAEKFRKEIAQYKAEIRDLAHGTIIESIAQDKDLKLRYRAAVFMLSKMGDEEDEDNAEPKLRNIN